MKDIKVDDVEVLDTTNKPMSDLLGINFNEDGSLASMSDIGNALKFSKMNRKQKRKNGIRTNKFKQALKRI